jgi:hypothetical protein
MRSIFAEVDSWAVALALGLAMFAAWQFGRWHGRRLVVESGEVPVSKFEDEYCEMNSLRMARMTISVMKKKSTAGKISRNSPVAHRATTADPFVSLCWYVRFIDIVL